MEYALLGWPEDGPTLRLDHERFSYAGKFVMSSTGKAVARTQGTVVAAVAFNRDRTDESVWWLRYVTVRADRRGEEVGACLCAFATERILDSGGRRVRIAVNNPFAYEALWKAGFGYTGEQTGLAELVLEHSGARDTDAYRAGLAVFRERDLTDAEASFLAARVDADPPATVDPP